MLHSTGKHLTKRRWGEAGGKDRERGRRAGEGEGPGGKTEGKGRERKKTFSLSPVNDPSLYPSHSLRYELCILAAHLLLQLRFTAPVFKGQPHAYTALQ